MHKKYFAPIILVAIFFITFFKQFAFAADDVSNLQSQINARKTQIETLQKQISETTKALQGKQKEKASLENQLELITGRLDKARLDLSATQAKLEQTTLEKQQTEKKIDAKRQEIDDQQVQVSELLRSLDFTERQSIVSIFASGKTLSDFFSMQDAVHAVDTQLTRALIKVLLAKQELDVQKTQLVTTEQTLASVKNTLIAKQDQLKNQSNAKAQLLLQTKQSEGKYQKLVADLKKQYSTTENEIQSIEKQINAQLKNKGKVIPTGAVQLTWPVPSHIVTALFHDPDYPFRNIFEHPAIDIHAGQGTQVRAAGNGIVGRAKNAGMGYSYILIVHNNKISTVYGHISRILVAEDQTVNAGDVIGLSGGTPGTPGAGPFVTGPHLHFEVRLNGIPVNPLDYLP
ncbi:MAG: peptidoglycan DD-metalloendopeptidase family protein [Candidatus Magasanikbacteria bacterium]|nr:peptidoglycan DD-metalloendopeptidase family protein [Candidatus Magasanikbacteria bacterium]